MIDLAAERMFRAEIDRLLDQVPATVMADAAVRVVHYSYMPWFRESSISFGTNEDRDRNPRTPADWTYFMAAKSDCSRVEDLVRSYETAEERGIDARLVYHSQLIAAASALLATDPTAFPEVPYSPTETRHSPTETRRRSFLSDGFPNGTFTPEVTDPDQSLTFNYCEYVLAQRLSRRGSTA